ncbi:hypothetical protein RZS08_05410, partial [Arthrospira platensis SPKY1]|nr:hypothetical protein [Arthrospira platensis SPKY1]
MLVGLLTYGLIGALMYGVAMALDAAMDYGHALGWIRWRVIVGKRGRVPRGTFEERVLEADRKYWTAALRSRVALGLLCLSCWGWWLCLAGS